MRILVTGAAGFLGRYVCRELQEGGHTAWGLDLKMALPTSNIVSTDITAEITLPEMVLPIDCIIHLAAVASPSECIQDNSLAFNVNVNGTYQVLKAALQLGVKRFVFSSSAHVYGISPRYLPTEERHPVWNQDCYTLTKIQGEQLCRLFYENHDLPYCILRLYNGYGPGQPTGYFVPDMIQKAKTGHIHLNGARITKDFIYAADVARAFRLAAESSFIGEINVGTGRESKLEEVAGLIARHLGATISLDGAGNYEHTRMQADIKRARRVLGWEPQVTLEEGIHEVLSQN